jgi:hypothetical protein
MDLLLTDLFFSIQERRNKLLASDTKSADASEHDKNTEDSILNLKLAQIVLEEAKEAIPEDKIRGSILSRVIY